MPGAGGRSDRQRGGHSLVEVLVATLLVATALLVAGRAIGAAIRWSRQGDAATRIALALATRGSRIQLVAGATTPRCGALADGAATERGLHEWWLVSGADSLREVVAHARLTGAGRPAEDSVRVLVRCE